MSARDGTTSRGLEAATRKLDAAFRTGGGNEAEPEELRKRLEHHALEIAVVLLGTATE